MDDPSLPPHERLAEVPSLDELIQDPKRSLEMMQRKISKDKEEYAQLEHESERKVQEALATADHFQKLMEEAHRNCADMNNTVTSQETELKDWKKAFEDSMAGRSTTADISAYADTELQKAEMRCQRYEQEAEMEKDNSGNV